MDLLNPFITPEIATIAIFFAFILGIIFGWNMK